MASNSTTIPDEAGEFDDWMEIYNAGSTSIDIGGLYISDDLDDLEKWQIPESDPTLTTIESGGFLILWLDGDIDQGILHTDFKLSASGEAIVLTESDGESVIDDYEFGSQIADVSYGRLLNGGNTWTAFIIPTPGTSNDDGIGAIEKPLASLPSGRYDTNINIELTNPNTNGQIHYTLDGSSPTHLDPIYNNPIPTDSSLTLRAIIAVDDTIYSRVMTHNYLYIVDHEFAVVCISTAPENFWDSIIGIYENYDNELEHPAHLEFFEPNSDLGFAVDIGVRLQGTASVNLIRKTLGIVARPEYGDAKINYPIFSDLPYDSYEAFTLRSSGQDFFTSLFRDAMSSGLVRDRGVVGALI